MSATEQAILGQGLVEDFAAAVAELRCDPAALGQQTRLVEAVAGWLERWQPAARIMAEGLPGQDRCPMARG